MVRHSIRFTLHSQRQEICKRAHTGRVLTFAPNCCRAVYRAAARKPRCRPPVWRRRHRRRQLPDHRPHNVPLVPRHVHRLGRCQPYHHVARHHPELARAPRRRPHLPRHLVRLPGRAHEGALERPRRYGGHPANTACCSLHASSAPIPDCAKTKKVQTQTHASA